MTAADLPSLPANLDYCVASQPNNSLDTRRRWTLFAALAAASLALAAVFAAAGAWLVLPYSAIEIALLAAACACVERHARDWERLAVCGDRVVLERRIGGRTTRHEWNRPWLVVSIDDDGLVRLGSEAVAFGSDLPAGERIAIARALRRRASAR
jgi:uncharacterized membrane protein